MATTTSAAASSMMASAAMGLPTAAGVADDGATPEEAALFANLCLLGVVDGADARAVGVAFPSRAAFRKPNARAVELVLYSCYAAVRGRAAAKRAFKGAWPPADARQQREFHQRAAEWLKELKEAGVLDAPAATAASALRAAAGPRLVGFLLELTHIALVVELARLRPAAAGGDCGGGAGGGDGHAGGDDVIGGVGVSGRAAAAALDADPRLLAELGAPALRVARAQARLHAQRFAAEAAAAAAREAEAARAAEALAASYYELTSRCARLEDELVRRVGRRQKRRGLV